MDKLIRVLEGKRANCSRGIQKAIREIDSSILARVLNSLDIKYHAIFFRNMTDTAALVLRREMDIQRECSRPASPAGSAAPRADIDLVTERLIEWTSEDFDALQEYPPYAGEISFDSIEETISTCVDISDFARKNGLMALNGLQDRTANPMFRKSLELMLLGIEPFRFDELLENYKKQGAVVDKLLDATPLTKRFQLLLGGPVVEPELALF